MSVQVVKEFPWEARLAPWPLANLLRRGGEQAQFLLRCQTLYEVRNPSGAIILIAGVTVWSFGRTPELWTLLARDFHQNLRESFLIARDALSIPLDLYGTLLAEVRNDFAPGHVLVKHLGFRPTGRPSLRPDGAEHTQYEVGNGL